PLDFAERAVEVDEAWPGEQSLDRHAIEAAPQRPQDLDLDIVDGSERGVAALAGHRGAAGCGQGAGAEARAGADDRDGGAGLALARRTDDAQVLRPEVADREGQAGIVIDQPGARDVPLRERALRKRPVHVGGP